MPRLTLKVPKYRKHKASGQAIVNLNGQDFYLGPHRSAQSRKLYDRLIAEWLEQKRTIPAHLLPEDQQHRGVIVRDLSKRYDKYSREYYNRSREHYNIREAFSVAVELYGDLPVNEFRPLCLRTVRDQMVKRKWCRNHVNAQVKRVIRVLSWGVANELVKAEVVQGLREIEPLKFGRTQAPETIPVKPATKLQVAATCRVLPPTLRTMVLLQWVTGMRPGEVCQIRLCDIDRKSHPWVYRPSQHKTAHHGHERTIFLGPRAQSLLRPFLANTTDEEHLFSPRRALAERYAGRETHRRTPNLDRKTKRVVGPCYDAAAYASAIRTACTKHKIEAWAPNQIRHAFATRIRALHGLETAQALLGHRSPDITTVYAEPNMPGAAKVIRAIG